jgi:hypothetical protein
MENAVRQEKTEWFFFSPAGRKHGPFPTREQAERAYEAYIRKEYALGEGLLNQD